MSLLPPSFQGTVYTADEFCLQDTTGPMDFLEESDSEPGPEICDVLNNCSIIVDRAHADVDGGLVIERDNKASQLEPDHSASVLNMLSCRQYQL